MKETTDALPSVAWFAEWLNQADTAAPLRSIVIGSRCSSNLRHIGTQVANYLNEFDSDAEGHWHTFTWEALRACAEDPNYRELLLADPAPDDIGGSDLDRIARRIASAGGAVLEGEHSLDATASIPNTFRICLCQEQPACLEPCHMWLNPNQFPLESLISVIADSFLDWNSRYDYHAGTAKAGGAQSQANTAEPHSPFPASL